MVNIKIGTSTDANGGKFVLLILSDTLEQRPGWTGLFDVSRISDVTRTESPVVMQLESPDAMRTKLLNTMAEVNLRDNRSDKKTLRDDKLLWAAQRAERRARSKRK